MKIVPYDHLRWDTDHHAESVAHLRLALVWPTLVVILGVATLRGHHVLEPALYAGAFCLVLSSLMTFTPAYSRFDQSTMLTIGALDLVALLAIGSVRGAVVAGALVVIPGAWLGGIFRLRGVSFVGLVGAIALALAGILDRSGALEAAGRISAIVACGALAAAAAARVVGTWVAQLDRLEAHRAALSAALASLGEEQERAAAVVDTVDVGLGVVGADGSYTSLNPRHAELMAIAYPAGHQGRIGEPGEIYAADNQTRINHSELPSVLAMRGEPCTETLWIGEQPAARRAIYVSSRPIRDFAGGSAGAVIAFHDVTAMMKAMAVKDEFVATVSHELRTPLTSIMGSLELAEDLVSDREEPLPHLIDVASRNADRLFHLVTDLLTISELQHSGMAMLVEAVDLSELVHESVQDVRDLAQRRGVELTATIAPGLRLVGDRSRLLQMTTNLLSNAVKYSSFGGNIWVELGQSGTHTLLTVKDTGIGVSEADQPELFTKFFRARSATDLKLPGVGLGLAISKEIVEAHGGTIALSSREGSGTTVLVTLPFGSAFELN
jgi:two-component system phosphate regulon sensor histidine kinase PhoR